MHGRVFYDYSRCLPLRCLSFIAFLFSSLHANRIGCHVMSHVILIQFPIGQSKRLHLHFILFLFYNQPLSQPLSLLLFENFPLLFLCASLSTRSFIPVRDNAVHAPCAMPLLV